MKIDLTDQRNLWRETTKASDCSLGRSPLLYGVRVFGRAWGIVVNATLQYLMTLGGQTFQKNFRWVVSEDLLDNTERIILNKLIGARLQHTTQLQLIVSRTKHFPSDGEWHNILPALGFDR